MGKTTTFVSGLVDKRLASRGMRCLAIEALRLKDGMEDSMTDSMAEICDMDSCNKL